MEKKWYFFVVGLLLALNVVCWQNVFTLNRPAYLRVDFFSVGQGDSEFITTPEGYQILIDGGPNARVLEKLAGRMPFWDKSIDIVILTHPEKDHLAGLLDVLQKYEVDYFLWTGVVKDSPENKKLAFLLEEVSRPQNSFLASLLSEKPTKVLTARAGWRIEAGNAVFDVLHPFEDLSGVEFEKSVNETSIVAKLIYGRNSFLFTGDISQAEEKQLTYSHELADLEVDVLKVAHHGSKYSTSELFLENVRPEYAVVEVGKNSYGHPTPETLQRLEKFGIKVFNTYTDGDIEMVSDGNNIYIK